MVTMILYSKNNSLIAFFFLLTNDPTSEVNALFEEAEKKYLFKDGVLLSWAFGDYKG
ncbi:MAG: hypothetical protein CM15mV137_180 [uncultured marine virus]|nr:MAG: hypothetical protein CM15mV137_180 [uncultured marine virus]